MIRACVRACVPKIRPTAQVKHHRRNTHVRQFQQAIHANQAIGIIVKYRVLLPLELLCYVSKNLNIQHRELISAIDKIDDYRRVSFE